MKNYLFTFLLLLPSFIALGESADSISQFDNVRLYSGFRFGFGGAKQRNTVIDGNDGKFALNPNMGATLWLRFNQHIGLMFEANYSLKGIKFKKEYKDTLSIYQRRLHYIEIPALIHASIGTQKFNEFFEFGIAPSYVSGIYDQTSIFVEKEVVTSSSQQLIYNRPLPLPTSRFDMSILMGAGMSILKGPGLLHIGFRTNVGLLDIYRLNRIGYINQNQRQFTFQIQIAYLWHVKSITKKSSLGL